MSFKAAKGEGIPHDGNGVYGMSTGDADEGYKNGTPKDGLKVLTRDIWHVFVEETTVIGSESGDKNIKGHKRTTYEASIGL